MTEEENHILEFVSGVKLSLLGRCVIKALERAPSAMACCLVAVLCSVLCSLVLPGLSCKPLPLGRAVTPQVGFNSPLVPQMVSSLLTLAQKVPSPADPGSACKDTARLIIKEKFRSAQLCNLFSSSCLSFFFFPPDIFQFSPLSSLTGGSCAAEKRGEKICSQNNKLTCVDIVIIIMCYIIRCKFYNQCVRRST